MPLYEYWCSECDNRFELVFKVEDRKQFVVCPRCSCSAERVISSHVQRDEPTWLPSAVGNLLPDGNDVRPIEDRGAYKKYLRDHNIVEAG